MTDPTSQPSHDSTVSKAVAYPICGGKKRQSDGVCTRPAGWGTDHAGLGRCKLHGGAKPIKTGRYSTIKREQLRNLIEQHEADPDPLNILPELAVTRALFQDFIERYDKWRDALLAWHESFGREGEKPMQMLDISDAYRIVSEATKIVERIEKIRAANAISRPDLFRVIGEMGRVVERFVTDPVMLEKIKDGWLSIRVA